MRLHTSHISQVSLQYFPTQNKLPTYSSDLKLTNHPVHIIDQSDKLSPSAFIPFCSFLGSLETVGRDYGNFPLPVCSSFQEVIMDGQLCYQFDEARLTEDISADIDLQKYGLSLLVDVNAEYEAEHFQV